MEKPKNEPVEFITVDAFIKSAAMVYPINNMQKAGFKAIMKRKGMLIAQGMGTYLPYLKDYLNIR